MRFGFPILTKNASFVRRFPKIINVQFMLNKVCNFWEKIFLFISTIFAHDVVSVS
jgi:hypothetical protein